ncbi:hypothetical protein AB0L30_10545 [Microbispora rosea]|uniref:hypothetical protein n=1 Tax=Microbispora rosea TaxID=58117 RepID=UPI00341730AB
MSARWTRSRSPARTRARCCCRTAKRPRRRAGAWVLRSCEIVTVQMGLVVSYQVYFDQLELLAQLGLYPAV